MRPKKAVRAALAGTRRDPLDVDRLVGTINKSPSILHKVAATAATQTSQRPVTVRRVRTRRLMVGRWPRQRQIIVVTIRTLTLGEVGP
jgi:hypothetical protein